MSDEHDKSTEVTVIGGTLADFNDLLGNDCTVNCVRMYDIPTLEVYSHRIGDEPEDTEVTTAYWTQAQVKTLLPFLERFADSGSFEGASLASRDAEIERLRNDASERKSAESIRAGVVLERMRWENRAEFAERRVEALGRHLDTARSALKKIRDQLPSW